MYILEIIDAAAIGAAAKLTLRTLVEQTDSTLTECDDAFKSLTAAKFTMNSPEHALRVETGSFEFVNQLAMRNLFANSVYRVRGARRRLQDLVKRLQEQIILLDSSEASARCLAVALKSLIGKCVDTGCCKPDAVLRELKKIRGVSRERIESEMRAIFLQKRRGEGLFAPVNFCAVAIMVSEADSAELRALYERTMEAERWFYKIRSAFDQCRTIRSKLNAYRFTESLQELEKELRRDRAEFYAVASHVIALVAASRAEVTSYQRVIEAAVATISDLPISKEELAAVSACMAGWNMLRELQMQQEIVDELNEWTEILARNKFDVDGFLAADPRTL